MFIALGVVRGEGVILARAESLLELLTILEAEHPDEYARILTQQEYEAILAELAALSQNSYRVPFTQA